MVEQEMKRYRIYNLNNGETKPKALLLYTKQDFFLQKKSFLRKKMNIPDRKPSAVSSTSMCVCVCVCVCVLNPSLPTERMRHKINFLAQ